MFSTFNVTVISRNETTRLYQTSRPHNRIHAFADAKAKLDTMVSDGKITSYDDDFGDTVVQIQVPDASAWDLHEDEILSAVILGTATPADKVFVYDKGNDAPRQTGEVLVEGEEKGKQILHYQIVDTVSV